MIYDEMLLSITDRLSLTMIANKHLIQFDDELEFGVQEFETLNEFYLANQASVTSQCIEHF